MLSVAIPCHVPPHSRLTLQHSFPHTYLHPRHLARYYFTCYISGVALLGSVDETADGYDADGPDIGGILYDEWVECGSP